MLKNIEKVKNASLVGSL